MKEKFKQWSDEFFTGKSIKFESEIGGLFFRFLMMEKMNESFPLEDEDPNLPFLTRIVKSRSKSINLNISNNAVLFLSALCDSPGSCVMYLYALKGKQLKDGKTVDMSELSFTFPIGFYDKEHLNKMWDKQKIKRETSFSTDNFLDLPNEELW